MLSSAAIAWEDIPSPVPVKPSPSSVVALILIWSTSIPSASAIFFRIASYTGGLPGDAIFDLKWATLFQGAAVALTAAALYKSLHEEKTEAVLTEVKA